MTNPVLENIRRSLGRTDRSPVGLRPAIYTPRQPQTVDAELSLFFDELQKLAGVGAVVNPADIAAKLKELVETQEIKKATLWHTPLIGKLGIEEMLRSLGVELVPENAPKTELAHCDLGVTEADYILPETGTIVLHASAEMPRATSLLPRVHLALTTPDMLRPDLHQVFAEGKGNSYMVFISGPSRTADIELTTALGVHGPKDLYVWMVRK
ncbi:MAG: LUD domain-containing protein [Chloroflexi bacterium]|nr:LUD domain-containing protein [Chloroflexota bacterium]